MKKVLVLLTLLLLLGGCSDPKTPNAKNFSASINKKLTEDNFACITFYLPFPANVVVGTEPRDPRYPKLEAMKQVGLLSSTETELAVRGFFGAAVIRPVHLYQITAAGQAALKDKSGKGLSEFCYAKPQVDKIIKWTEPGSILGETATEVTYTYQLTDIASWANDNNVRVAFPEIADTVQSAGRVERHQELILTNIGWEALH